MAPPIALDLQIQAAFKERLAGKAVDKKLVDKLGLWHAREALGKEIV